MRQSIEHVSAETRINIEYRVYVSDFRTADISHILARIITVRREYKMVEVLYRYRGS